METPLELDLPPTLPPFSEDSTEPNADPTFLFLVGPLSISSRLFPFLCGGPPYLGTLSTWDSQWPHQARTQVHDSSYPACPPWHLSILTCSPVTTCLQLPLLPPQLHSPKTPTQGFHSPFTPDYYLFYFRWMFLCVCVYVYPVCAWYLWSRKRASLDRLNFEIQMVLSSCHVCAGNQIGISGKTQNSLNHWAISANRESSFLRGCNLLKMLDHDGWWQTAKLSREF